MIENNVYKSDYYGRVIFVSNFRILLSVILNVRFKCNEVIFYSKSFEVFLLMIIKMISLFFVCIFVYVLERYKLLIFYLV